ncbi:hypothetical protein DSM104443_01299 [Usitatibacter rugosus]|uniref:Uncharacterized protein n=1 Tax=Usitatibacter rugosus TaxID=2732067 RepID=A0A6M4GT92_9PROT|nr:hypothetical protein [Usitatibacter rugosus]QJR10245.1 hypothetical protein DSM104443_01299 [Usitatibacter rugosus]
MRRSLKYLGTLLLAATLGACSVLPESSTSTTAPPPPRPPSTADELVAYLARLRDLDDTGLTLEATRQREFIKQQPGEVSRLKLALALSALQSEESEILMLVEPLAREPKGIDPDVRAMASFLQHQTVERRKLKETAAAAGTKAKDDRRALESQRQRADTLQERNAQLQQKLDALTNLEKSLSGRKGN